MIARVFRPRNNHKNKKWEYEDQALSIWRKRCNKHQQEQNRTLTETAKSVNANN